MNEKEERRYLTHILAASENEDFEVDIQPEDADNDLATFFRVSDHEEFSVRIPSYGMSREELLDTLKTKIEKEYPELGELCIAFEDDLVE